MVSRRFGKGLCRINDGVKLAAFQILICYYRAMTAIADIRRSALRSLIPPPRIALSQWIERNINLPEPLVKPGTVWVPFKMIRST